MQQYTDLQLLGYLVISIIFVITGWFMLDDMMIVGLIDIAFLGLGVVIFIYQLFKRRFNFSSKKSKQLEFPNEILIEKVDINDEEVLEDWLRKCDGNHQQFHSVSAIKTVGSKFQWQVFFSAGEFIREEPYESELVKTIYNAILDTKGVTETAREDTEVFAVDGSPSGEDLVRNVSTAIDKFMVTNLSKWISAT